MNELVREGIEKANQDLKQAQEKLLHQEVIEIGIKRL